MKRLISVAMLCTISTAAAHASNCSVAEVLELQKRGLTQQRIEEQCRAKAGLPQWLNGDWQVYLKEGNSPANRLAFGMLGVAEEIWRVRVNGDILSISTLSNYHLGGPYVQEESQRVFDIQPGNQSVSFRMRSPLGGVYQFSLNLTNEEDVRGDYSMKDDWHPGLPASEMFGSVVMKKLD